MLESDRDYLIWFASFFDAEGCIDGGQSGNSARLDMRIGQDHRESLFHCVEFADRFDVDSRINENWSSPNFVWRVSGGFVAIDIICSLIYEYQPPYRKAQIVRALDTYMFYIQKRPRRCRTYEVIKLLSSP